MQKEVAARLLASPGSKDYGRLTLAVRYAADVRHGFDIPPSCFTPRPEVDSSALLLTFHPAGSLRSEEESFLFDLIKIAFSQRRKTLLHLLSRDPRVGLDRSRLEKIFASLGLSPKVRGEELLLKDFLALAKELKTPIQK